MSHASLIPVRASPIALALLAPLTAACATPQADEGADYTLLEKLGEGSFGKVFKAQQHSAGRHVAIKVVPVAQDTGEVAREIEMLKECQSDNIVRYYGSFQRGPELWIVMEVDIHKRLPRSGSPLLTAVHPSLQQFTPSSRSSARARRSATSWRRRAAASPSSRSAP